jgi:spore germination cell wall hydrolase CwlJ-like protein
VRVRLLLFMLALAMGSSPVYASLGSAPQCVPPNSQVKKFQTKLPVPRPNQSIDLSVEDRDYMIRTMVFEAGTELDEGKAAVAHVILNRQRSGRWGDSIKEVVTAPWQFEPWMTRRKQIKALSIDHPSYQDAARVADAILSGEFPDPTEGATHFLNPKVVRKRRGGSLPAWARGEGQRIGRHTFYTLDEGIELLTVSMDGLRDAMSCSPQEQLTTDSPADSPGPDHTILRG